MAEVGVWVVVDWVGAGAFDATDETGAEVEFSIIDNVACGGERYLLVVETELMDDDETDAIILKEVSINTDDVTYELVEDDAEFDRVADLFAQKAEDYDVELG